MASVENLKSKRLLNANVDYSFDYPEVFVLLITVALVVLHYNFKATSLALFVIISLPSLMILIYNYRRETSFWTSNIVVILLAALIGALQFCAVIALSLGLLIIARIIISAPENRLRLAIVALVTMFVLYYVSITLKHAELDCYEGFMPITILISSMLVVLWQFWSIYNQYLYYHTTQEQSKVRLNTMVSVINKLTRFVPPQIWQPIVKSDSAVPVANKRAKLSIMFSDIIGFTELSDSLSADNLADILNTYMNVMTVIATKHGAVLDKFIGDGMVCLL